MRSQEFWSSHARLLASAALLLSLPLASQAAAADDRLARQDLGPVDSGTSIAVTIWLKSDGPDTLGAAISERTTVGSTVYHQWMTPDEVLSYGARSAQVDRLSSSLEAAGLRVVRRESDNSALRVTGSAKVMKAAFATDFHLFSRNGRQFRANTSEPRFEGAGAEIIAGMTGLSSATVTPFVLTQADPVTGKPMRGVPAASVLNPFTIFTDTCFKQIATVKLAGIGLGVGSELGRYTGPRYLTRNLPTPPFKTCGYTASQVAAKYGLPAVYAKGFTGEGQTIVIVDAYGSPTIQSDANTFSTMMGLPAFDSTNLQVIYPDGPPITSPYNTDWPLEVSLDVEWAHAMAPKAKIVLVVAPSDNDSELAYALHYAISKKLGGVISNSYGSAEAGVGPAVARAYNTVIKQAAAEGIAVMVATGDDGDFGLGTPVGAPSVPADSPYATGVGGTSLNVPSDSGPVDSVWGATFSVLGGPNGVAVPPSLGGFAFGGGGGESLVFEKPAWQAKAGLPGVGRQLPDISAIADPYTGGIIVADRGDGQAAVLLTIGGTSLATPVFSGIWALAQQAAHEGLGQAAPVLATMPVAAFTDIVPVQASRSNLAGTTTQPGTNSPLPIVTHYTAADVLGLTLTQPNGFVGTSATVEQGTVIDLGFGADSSLMTAPGWDTATGYGEPNGWTFIKAARAAALPK